MNGSPGTRAPAWYWPAGVLIGLAGALCGIGGGVFAGPLLHATRALPLKRATATALIVVLATTAAATAGELVAALARAHSFLTAEVALPLALGGILGAQLGFRAAQRIDERPLKGFFALVLLFAGVRVLLFGPSGIAQAENAGPLATTAIALAVGTAGGFLTPLFGVGGGLIMVPGLYFTLDGLGFNGARACSLAAGAVAAMQSLWLHARRGNVAWALGWPLALGAIGGAVAGVFAVRHEAFATAGRVLLGLILVVQAAGFARDLRRAASRSAAR